MNKQAKANIPLFMGELQKMANCIYIAAEAEAAADVNLKTRKVIQLVNDLVRENEALTDSLKAIESLRGSMDTGRSSIMLNIAQKALTPRECNSCDWEGLGGECRKLGSVGPLCPICGETTVES